MGKMNQAIINGVDIEKLIGMLNEALSEEWLAYYQYWIGARVIEGAMRSAVEGELLVHAKEELEHAEKLAERIIQLNGTPVLSPEEWFKLAGCKYTTPTDTFVEGILKDNLGGERCAIQRYKEIMDYTFGKDHATYNMALSILEDELEHEQEIEDWLNDLKITMEYQKKK